MKLDLIKYLEQEINENKLSHAFLVETNDINKLLVDIYDTLLSNNICNNKSIENNPDVRIILPENNLIEKDKILDLQKFILTKSQTNNYKIYFICNAELMNTFSCNKLLKALEEPASNVIGFLLTSNENQIISTIRSRCILFKKNYDEIASNYSEELVNKVTRLNECSFKEAIKTKKDLSTLGKEEIISVLEQSKININNIVVSNGDASLLAKKYKILDNIIDLMKKNGNTELCLDKLIIEMRS